MIRRVIVAAFGLLLIPSTVGTQPKPPIRGFTATSSEIQRQIEDTFRLVPKPENNREYMRVTAAEPHHAGSPGSRKVADYVLAQFKSWGLNASVETFEAMIGPRSMFCMMSVGSELATAPSASSSPL